MATWDSDFGDQVSTAASGQSHTRSTTRAHTQASAAFNVASHCARRVNTLEHELTQLARTVQQQAATNARLRDQLRHNTKKIEELLTEVGKVRDSTQTLFVLVQGLNNNFNEIREYLGLEARTACLTLEVSPSRSVT